MSLESETIMEGNSLEIKKGNYKSENYRKAVKTF